MLRRAVSAGSEDPRERDPQTYAIIGAAMEVHRRIGLGFSKRCITKRSSFAERNVPYARKVDLRIEVLNYLKATGLRRGLLINFGAESLEHKRFVL